MKCTYCNSSKPRYSLLIIVGLFILLCISLFVGYKRSEPEGRAVTNDYWYVIAKIDGHDYVMGGLYRTSGAGLTHSESCRCKLLSPANTKTIKEGVNNESL